MKILSLVFLSAIIFTCENGYSWGSYGHEQINSEAVDLLKQTSLGACLAKSRDFMVRLAITPDADWKMGSQDSFALNIYKLADQFSSHPNDPKYLLQLQKILNQEEKKTKKRILSDEFIASLREKPSDQNLLNQLKDQEAAAGGLGPLDYVTLLKKRGVDRFEHSLHFWEADAFVSGGANISSSDRATGITGLKNSSHYDSDDLGDYEKRMNENSDYITKIDPCKTPSDDDSRDVVQHGTAPWRIYSLLKQGATALAQAVKNHDEVSFNRALRRIGTMGHYVGDMGQPFHATLNYDGQGTGAATMGIHSIYEEKILERAAHARQDKETKLWSSFGVTNPVVDKYARKSLGADGLHDIADDNVIPSVFTLVSNGYLLIDPLLEKFKKARLDDKKYKQLDLPLAECGKNKKGNGSTTAIHAVTEDEFSSAQIQWPGQDTPITVLESAERRMGEASALLAQLWLTAAKMAKVNDADFKAFCPSESFDPKLVINDYPAVDYHKPVVDFSKYPPKRSSNGPRAPNSVKTKAKKS